MTHQNSLLKITARGEQLANGGKRYCRTCGCMKPHNAVVSAARAEEMAGAGDPEDAEVIRLRLQNAKLRWRQALRDLERDLRSGGH